MRHKRAHAPVNADAGAPGGSYRIAVAHQLCAVQGLGKQLFAKCDGLLLVELAEPMCVERFFRRLDDEGRGLAVELVDMGLEPAVLGLAKIKRKRIEELVSAEPNVAVRPYGQIGLEVVGVTGAYPGTDAVGASFTAFTTCVALVTTVPPLPALMV